MSIHRSKIHTNFIWLLPPLFFLWLSVFLGCAALLEKKAPEDKVLPVEEWNPQNYSKFLQQNMKFINEKYSTDYIPYDFIVDIGTGSTIVQRLIEPELVSPLVDSLRVKDLEDKEQILFIIYDYVLEEYDYKLDAYLWPGIEETVKTKKGDCKGLSLLLMSLLLSAGFDTYVAISNGHMWTNVYHDNEWHVFEVDKSPERSKIYDIPGFYEHPLFKIFKDQTYKRKKK
jgi:hypothetical protein